jgi:nitrogen fixation protein FixH
VSKGAGNMKFVLLLVAIVGVGAVIGAFVLGKMSFEGTVSEHPYEEGLKRDEVRKEHERLGWQLELTHQEFTVGHAEIGVHIRKADESPLAGADVMLVVSRPNTNEYNKPYNAHQIFPGVYRADVELPLYGYWDIQFTVRKGKDELDFTRRVYARQPQPE